MKRLHQIYREIVGLPDISAQKLTEQVWFIRTTGSVLSEVELLVRSEGWLKQEKVMGENQLVRVRLDIMRGREKSICVCDKGGRPHCHLRICHSSMQ